MTAARRQVTDLAGSMTADEFLAMPNDGIKYELVDGYLEAMPPASPTHGRLQVRLGTLVDQHLTATASSCWAATEIGIQPVMRAGVNVRIPDFGVTCHPQSPDDQVMQKPRLMVEIFTPSNARKTAANVWLYATIPSVTEILLVHTTAFKLELFLRNPDGTWPTDGIVAGDC
jgi:Uma2 family endonuclease